jgi:hypothetical protein
MRLLTSRSHDELKLTKDFVTEAPPYAILSHTWGPENDEVLFEDLIRNVGISKVGYSKLLFCATQTAKDGLEYFWADTCCINKSSSSELSEAVNSMFRWYAQAVKCYVFLSDVHVGSSTTDAQAWLPSFESSRWFTRGWTLQELLAPASIDFFSADGAFLGNKKTLEPTIHKITKIPIEALRGCPLSQFTVQERLSWAADRHTRREEDQAYCLFGIFNVFLPLLYGEGRRATDRLLREVATNAEVRPRRKDLRKPPALLDRPPKRGKFRQEAVPPLEPYAGISATSDKASDLHNDESYYQPLEEHECRVLILEPGAVGTSITGHIQHFNLQDPPTYHALSYVWGTEPRLQRVTISNTTVNITPNLYHALQRVRLIKGTLPLWVDSLCINQSDTTERTAQIQHIGSIYRKASAVLIWLGEEDSTSKAGLNLVRTITDPSNLHYKWGDRWWEEHPFRALDSLLARPWFERGWVIQEAACSKYSTILCGDGKVYMGNFVMAVSLIQSKLKPLVPKLGQIAKRGDAGPLSHFLDSPAVRLLEIVNNAFRVDAHGDNVIPKLTLESLVDLSTFSQTTDHRDAIYALLGLANDLVSANRAEDPPVVIPSYEKPVLDVFADFVLHCCQQSGSLDIICRPWAPVPSIGASQNSTDGSFGDGSRRYPSWIVSRDKLPFGDPSYRHRQRLHADSLVGRSGKRTFNAHRGTKPRVSVGKHGDGSFDGTLHARGFVIGRIDQRSTRLASAIISKECLSILCQDIPETQSGVVDIPCALWRTLCADRDQNGDPAPRVYQTAMFHLLHMTSSVSNPNGSTNFHALLSDIDIEEVLDTDVPEHVRNYLMVVGGVVWNRRTFRCNWSFVTDSPLVGLAPQGAKVDDSICILSGCSVPVVLRERLDLAGGGLCHELIGEAFVYGAMDGDLFAYGSGERSKIEYVDFIIR